jgi:hypothetical protein
MSTKDIILSSVPLAVLFLFFLVLNIRSIRSGRLAEWQSDRWIYMRKSLPLLLLSCLCQIGCVGDSHPQQAEFFPIKPVPPAAVPHYDSTIPRRLSDDELRDLVNAANKLAMFGTPFPDHVLQRMKPVEIYNDLCNVVVALHRDAHEEQGYYIATLISSYLPAGHERGFTWERVDVSRVPGIYSDVYVYRRAR